MRNVNNTVEVTERQRDHGVASLRGLPSTRIERMPAIREPHRCARRLRKKPFDARPKLPAVFTRQPTETPGQSTLVQLIAPAKNQNAPNPPAGERKWSAGLALRRSPLWEWLIRAKMRTPTHAACRTNADCTLVTSRRAGSGSKNCSNARAWNCSDDNETCVRIIELPDDRART